MENAMAKYGECLHRYLHSFSFDHVSERTA